MNAMILAAGFGTRMRPFTDENPKPMVPVNGLPLLCYTLAWLKKNGITDVVINLHHHGEKIVKHFGNGKRFGLRIRYSRENKILGTGGGIKKALRYLDDEFLIVNGDIVFDLDLRRLLKQHSALKNPMATLLVRQVPDAKRYGVVGVLKGQVQNILGEPRVSQTLKETMFAGVSVFNKKNLMQALKQNKKLTDFFCIIRDVEIPFLKSGGQMGAFLHRGFWRVNDNLADVAQTAKILRQQRLSYAKELQHFS